MTSQGRYVWMHGRLLDAEHATVPFLTAGLHYGIAVFDGIRCYATRRGPAIFRLHDHMERLIASARVLGFRDLPFGALALAEAAKDTVRANRLDACYIRPLLYLTGGGWNLTVDSGRLEAGIAVWPWEDYLGAEARELGVRANVASFTRHHPNIAMTKAKIAGNYVSSVLAKTESLRLGFDEAIMLDPQGYVAECTGENIFLSSKGALRTPPTGAALAGITRETVLVLARELGLAIHEEPISRDDLYLAEEVFVCGTAAEIVALREIDFRAIGSGRTGPVTRELQRRYEEATRGAHPRSDEWLDYVAADSTVASSS